MELILLLLALVAAIALVKASSKSDTKPTKSHRPTDKKPVVRSPRNSPVTRDTSIESKVKQNASLTDNVEHAPPPPIPASLEIRGRAYVIDGDTIAINRIKIRLAGIDAPELDRPWGQKSKWQMVKICKGHEIHVKLTGETSYDRLVGTCYLPDGTDIGAEIIKAGLALDGGYYSEGKYRHLEPNGIRRKLKPYGNQIRS